MDAHLRHSTFIFAFSLVLFFYALPGLAATEINFESNTLVRSYERDTISHQGITLIPIYEYLQLDVGALSKPGFSVHVYGWGRTDGGDGQYFDDNEASELLYGYLEYTTDRKSFNARLGRQHIFDGPAGDSIDGLRLSGRLTPYFTVMAFAGLPVSLGTENGSEDDSIYGGKLSHTFKELYNIGLSYRKTKNFNIDEEETLALDLFVALPKGVDLSGLSSRNMDTEEWGEHLYELRFKISEIDLRPFFQQIEYENLFNTGTNSANPFRYLAGTGETLTMTGSDFAWTHEESWDFGLKLKSYNFDQQSSSALFYSGLATWHGEDMTQAGIEAGKMQGDDQRNEYLLTRLFVYWTQVPFDLPIDFVTSDLVYVRYDRDINNESDSLFLSLGAGMKFFDDSLEVKLSGDYSSDPYYTEDYKGMLLLTYIFKKMQEEDE